MRIQNIVLHLSTNQSLINQLIAMTSATFNIAKSLTIVVGSYVYITNLSNLINESNKYDNVTLNGVTKIEKFNKYVALMLANGYSVVTENWKRDFIDGVLDYSITFKK